MYAYTACMHINITLAFQCGQKGCRLHCSMFFDFMIAVFVNSNLIINTEEPTVPLLFS